jgi:RIO kinase 1
VVTLTGQERFRTEKGVFDNFTKRNLFKMQSEGVFDKIVSPLFVGKESNVFIGEKEGVKIIIKIYRIQNNDFKRMFNYIKQDRRYEELKNKRREIIFSWAQREYRNLLKAAEAKLNVPKVLGYKMNIIVEEMIGDDEPALRLKDSAPENPKKFFNEVVRNMSKLYHQGLVHGDLSSFNILNHNEKPYFIDFSQSTLIKTPNSDELLERDVKNILSYFKKLGINEDYDKIFNKIKSFKK